MARILQMEFPELAGRIISLAYLVGLPLAPRRLVEMITEKESAFA